MKTIMLFATLTLCAAGPARSAVDAASETSNQVERPDGWITGKVKSSLMFHKNVSGLSTAVETKSGVVTLRGEADNQAQKDLATEYASEVEGVDSVINMMTVKGERTVDARIDDATITAQIKSALLTRRATSALNTTVKTYNGSVTLGGAAKNEAEKELAERLTRGVDGVQDVQNRMTIGR